MKNIGRIVISFMIIVMVGLSVYSFVEPPNQQVLRNDTNLKLIDPYTLAGRTNLLTGHEPLNADGDINVVVEIPTGTISKWEVDKPSGELRWEFKNGKPRRVNYLGYPGNYGMIPRTLLPKELGGDGDPLDVIILGPAVARGSVVKARLIGILRMLDRGEQDDKLIAVLRDTPLYKVKSLKELDEKFKGITEIVRIWFANYKGPGKMKIEEYQDEKEARKVLDLSIKAFAELQK